MQYKIMTDTDREQIMQIDPEMKRIIESGVDLFNIFPGTQYYYCYVNDELVAHIYVQSPNDNPHTVLRNNPNGFLMNNMSYIWAVETLEKYRGKGYGSQMMQYVIQPNQRYFLRVKNENHDAIRLYKKFGFAKDHDFNEKEQIMML